MNTVVLLGRLTKKPELGYTSNNTAVTRFSIAVDRPKKNGEDAGADFPSITVYGKTAENVCRYMDKGRQIAVMGHIQTGSYKKGDTTIYTTDVIADRVEFIGNREKPQERRSPQVEDFLDGFDTGFSGVEDAMLF